MRCSSPRVLLTASVLMSGTLSAAHALGLSANEWQIRFSRGMPSNPAQEQDGSWSFRFPAKSHGELDYVTRSYTKAIEKGRIVTMTFEIVASADAVWNHKTEGGNTCSSPKAAVRFILQKRRDDLASANGRFWSNPGSVVLNKGRYTLSVPLIANHWTNVEGRRSEKGFSSILGNIGNLGITFGGGCFFGHGVNLERGTAKFRMRIFEIR
jgi:hypothetical protein